MAAAQGKEFWEKKDFKQWSEKECRNLLQKSPWAQTRTLSQVVIESIGAQTPSTTPGREANPRIEYQVQFRSALPIRQAFVRLSQITQKYDQLSPEQKQAFDQNAEQFLARTFPDVVIVVVGFNANVPSDELDLIRHWQTHTTETLKNSVFLIGAGGKRIPLLRYVPPSSGREFQFVFPREYEGRAAAGPGDKSLMVEFQSPAFRNWREERILVEFKVEKMQRQDAVIY
jgi:hypothetical protein